MKKAVVITLVKNAVDESFGPAMQIYATQKFLELYHIKAETMIDESCHRSIKEKILRGLDELRNGKTGIKKIFNKVGANSPQSKSEGTSEIERNLVRKRKENYGGFINEYIRISNITERDLLDVNEKVEQYDYFAVGSDQIWNPYYPQDKRIKYLEFCDASKKITMAPSIAIPEIPKRFREEFSYGMNSFDKISVREDKGAELIKKYSGKEATVVLDPTMMLNVEHYKSIMSVPKCAPKGGYLVAYFMGYEDINTKLEEIAKEKNLEIVWLRRFEFPQYYILNPSEYLGLLDSADLICTDSFHMTIFSMLFHKPLLVFDRDKDSVNSMSSRLDTLLDKFQMSDIKFSSMEQLSKAFQIDYERFEEILKMERKKTLYYYDEAIGEERVNEISEQK